MLKNKFFFLSYFFLILLVKPASAVGIGDSIAAVISVGDTIYVKDSLPVTDPVITKGDVSKENKKKRIVSAICSFPFPFGFMGAHRVMLGTKPWVPIVYVATFGGCFGLLPLIDFFVITFSKDIEQYENNPHIFMWVK